jgi:hypothetical protein
MASHWRLLLTPAEVPKSHQTSEALPEFLLLQEAFFDYCTKSVPWGPKLSSRQSLSSNVNHTMFLEPPLPSLPISRSTMVPSPRTQPRIEHGLAGPLAAGQWESLVLALWPYHTQRLTERVEDDEVDPSSGLLQMTTAEWEEVSLKDLPCSVMLGLVKTDIQGQSHLAWQRHNIVIS